MFDGKKWTYAPGWLRSSVLIGHMVSLRNLNPSEKLIAALSIYGPSPSNPLNLLSQDLAHPTVLEKHPTPRLPEAVHNFPPPDISRDQIARRVLPKRRLIFLVFPAAKGWRIALSGTCRGKKAPSEIRAWSGCRFHVSEFAAPRIGARLKRLRDGRGRWKQLRRWSLQGSSTTESLVPCIIDPDSSLPSPRTSSPPSSALLRSSPGLP